MFLACSALDNGPLVSPMLQHWHLNQVRLVLSQRWFLLHHLLPHTKPPIWKKQLWTVQLDFSKEETTLKQVLRIQTKIFIILPIWIQAILIIGSQHMALHTFSSNSDNSFAARARSSCQSQTLSDGCPSGCHQNRKPIGSNNELRGRFWQCQCLFTIDLPQYIPGIC